MDRKKFLQKTGLFGLGVFSGTALASAKLKPNKAMKDLRKIITVEEHFSIPAISAKVMDSNIKKFGVNPHAQVQKDLMAIVLPTMEHIEDIGEDRLKFMDDSGIDMQILSYGAMSPQNISDAELALQLSKECNDYLARKISVNPNRFAGFAVLPLANPKDAAKELERCVKELGFKGAMINGTFNGKFLDDENFYPIFAKAQELEVPVFMHPAIINPDISKYYYAGKNWSPVAAAMFATAGYGWHAHSGISVIRLIISGLFEKFPKLQIISGHWGELVPFYLNRLDDQLGKTLNLPRKISDYYKSNIFISPSGFFNENQLKYAIAEVGAERILYAGDYPFLIDRNTKNFLQNANIEFTDKEKIAFANAEKLFK